MSKVQILFSDCCFPLQVFAKSQIDTLTAQAWLLGSKQLEEKVCSIFLMFTGTCTNLYQTIMEQSFKKLKGHRCLDAVSKNEIRERHPVDRSDTKDDNVSFLQPWYF